MITLLLLVRATYMYGLVLHTHPIHGESHNQRNTTGEVATIDSRRKTVDYDTLPINFWVAVSAQFP